MIIRFVLFLFSISFVFAGEWNKRISDYILKNGCELNHEDSNVSAAGDVNLNCSKFVCKMEKIAYVVMNDQCRLRKNGIKNFSSYVVVPNFLVDLKVYCDFVKVDKDKLIFSQSGICPIGIKNYNSVFRDGDYGVLFFQIYKDGKYAKKIQSKLWVNCINEEKCFLQVLSDKFFYGMGESFETSLKNVDISCDFINVSKKFDKKKSIDLYFSNEGYCEIGVKDYMLNDAQIIHKLCLRSIRDSDKSFSALYTKCQ